MTEDQQRVAIFKALGWQDIHGGPDEGGIDYRGTNPDNNRVEFLPKLPDLNDMYKMEEAKDMHRNQAWIEWLLLIRMDDTYKTWSNTDGWDWAMMAASATESQRREAFLKTLELWT